MSVTTEVPRPVLRATTLVAVADPCLRLAFLTCKPAHVLFRRRTVDPVCSNIKDAPAPKEDDDGAINPGSNLFVTGIHPRLSEAEVSKMFEKYGEVEKCQIMRDPHTKESRGFGFVKMVTSEQAEAAREGLQGEVIEGRTMSIEKARRARPRTPTPGKYFGPPKRGMLRFSLRLYSISMLNTKSNDRPSFSLR